MDKSLDELGIGSFGRIATVCVHISCLFSRYLVTFAKKVCFTHRLLLAVSYSSGKKNQQFFLFTVGAGRTSEEEFSLYNSDNVDNTNGP